MKLLVLNVPFAGRIFRAGNLTIFNCPENSRFAQAGCLCSLCKGVQHALTLGISRTPQWWATIVIGSLTWPLQLVSPPALLASNRYSGEQRRYTAAPCRVQPWL